MREFLERNYKEDMDREATIRLAIKSPSADPGRGASDETGVVLVLEGVGMGRAVAAASDREKRADSPDCAGGGRVLIVAGVAVASAVERACYRRRERRGGS